MYAVRSKKIQPLSRVLGAVLKGGKIGKKVIEFQAKEAWPEIAGQPLSLHSNVAQFKKGVLVVRCANSSWVNELSFYKADLMRKMNEKLSQKAIKDIVFFVGDSGEGTLS